jgi:hypothetical protein
MRLFLYTYKNTKRLISLFSKALLDHPVAKNRAALARVELAKKRIQSILDRETVAHERTLEQKISDQGPIGQRVDPHLITLALRDLRELRRLSIHHHESTKEIPWYSNIATHPDIVVSKLNFIAPLYSRLTDDLKHHLGYALELVTYKALEQARQANPRYHFDGVFELSSPLDNRGFFKKINAPTSLNGHSTRRSPDFIQHGHNVGSLCIECKNRREWVYPDSDLIKHHILRCNELNVAPVFISRRLHYTTITNFLIPAGIIAHETLFQYLPSEFSDFVSQVKDKRSLGFTDLVAADNPHPRTAKFFLEDLPVVAEHMSQRWNKNRSALVDFAQKGLNISQLYSVIGSPAGGKWQQYPHD